MRPRIVVPTLLVGILVGIATIAAACGGDGEATLEEYFEQLQALSDDIDARLEPLQADLEGASGDDPTLFRDVFAEYVEIIEDGRSNLDDLNPPAEAQAAHDAFGDALAAMQVEFDDVVGRLGDTESTADVLDVLTGGQSQLDVVQQQFDAACLSLESLASDNGITIDLQCE